MNLSLTPLSEAYNSPKIRQKTKVNIHSNTDTQKEILQKASLKVHNSVPIGYEGLHSGSDVEHKSEDKIDENSLTVKILDPELIDMLKIYKDDYISELFKNLLVQSKTTKASVETFVDKNNESFLETNIILGILIFLLVADIVLRLKYKQ